MSKKLSRREFLGKSAGAAAAGVILPTIIPASALGKDGHVAPSERIVCGIIGNGMQSGGHRNGLAGRSESQVVAVCDVDMQKAEKAKKEVESKGRGECAIYEDYQELIERPDIDAVCIVTPDHWHVAQALYASNRGKHVYCEKPLTLTIEEGRILSDAVKRNNTILQVGSQQRSEWAFRKAAELVRNGYIGEIKEIFTNIGEFPPPQVLPAQEVPSYLNYDKWLGQAPWVPYNYERVKGDYGGGWRRYWDYGSRKEGDWGAHHFDIIQWAMGKDDSGPTLFAPAGYDGAKWRFYQYENGPRVYVNPGSPTKGEMIRFVGEKGDICVSRGGRLYTNDYPMAYSPLKPGSKVLHPSDNHMTDWLECIKTGRQPIATAEIGHRTATICHLNAFVLRLGRAIKWDPKNEVVIGDEEAKLMQSRARRAPYYLGA